MDTWSSGFIMWIWIWKLPIRCIVWEGTIVIAKIDIFFLFPPGRRLCSLWHIHYSAVYSTELVWHILQVISLLGYFFCIFISHLGWNKENWVDERGELNWVYTVIWFTACSKQSTISHFSDFNFPITRKELLIWI